MYAAAFNLISAEASLQSKQLNPT